MFFCKWFKGNQDRSISFLGKFSHSRFSSIYQVAVDETVQLTFHGMKKMFTYNETMTLNLLSPTH